MTKQAAHGGKGSSVGMNDGEAGENAHKNNALSPRGEGAEAVAFSASDRACYEYPGADEQPLRAAFVHGATLYAHPAGGEAFSLVDRDWSDRAARQGIFPPGERCVSLSYEAGEIRQAGGEAPSVVGAAARLAAYAALLEAAVIGPGGSKGDLTERANDIRAVLAALATLQADGGHGSSAAPPTEQAETPVVGWQPIETAPRDGTWVDLFLPNNGDEVVSQRITARWITNSLGLTAWHAGRGFNMGDTATHWMPLPPAPTDTTGEA